MIVAIDPGINGAAAALGKDGFVDVIDLPTFSDDRGRREINPYDFYGWLHQMNPTRIVMENVHSMPKQGVVGIFNFGMAIGTIKTVCDFWIALGRADIDVELVQPEIWKGYFQLPGKDKEAARQMAIRLFPDPAYHLLTRKLDHNRAEAMLIAWWAARPPIGRNW